MSYFGAIGAPLGFKVRVGSALEKCNAHSLRSTSGATPTNLLMTSCFPTCLFHERQ